jgi:hypothetical protein
VNVAIDPGLGRCSWIGPNVTRIAMRQVEGREDATAGGLMSYGTNIIDDLR